MTDLFDALFEVYGPPHFKDCPVFIENGGRKCDCHEFESVPRGKLCLVKIHGEVCQKDRRFHRVYSHPFQAPGNYCPWNNGPCNHGDDCHFNDGSSIRCQRPRSEHNR